MGVVLPQAQSASVTPLLKSWSSGHEIDDITYARTSNEGEFIAALTVSHSVFITHISKPYEDHHVIGNDVHSFIWGTCDWKNEKCLDYPTADNYLITTGIEHNINLFCISQDEKDLFSCKLYNSIEPCLLCFDEDIPSINNVDFICSLRSIDGLNHRIICIINKTHIIQITISTADIYLERTLSLDKFNERKEYKDLVKLHAYKDGLIYVLTENLMIYILSAIDFNLVNKINIYERLQLYDVIRFGVSNYDNSHTLTLITAEYHITFIKLGDVIPSESAEETISHHDLWKDMLKHTKKIYKHKTLKPNTSIMVNWESSIPLPVVGNDLRITDFHVSNSTVIIMQEDFNGAKFLTKYDRHVNEFAYEELQSGSCISFCWNEYYPMLLLSQTNIAIPTFLSTHEELIDRIIQYNDIVVAERICKLNNWDQFSMPLHTLAIGLQQRQLDVISFFLKSREKTFTHYWGEIMGSSKDASNSTDISVMVDEASEWKDMHASIEMLGNAIASNSIGKHKQNFFEGLLRITMKYLNELLQDGVNAIEIKNSLATEVGMSFGDENNHKSSDDVLNDSSSFLYDISNSMKYLTEKLIDLRKFLRHPIAEEMHFIDEMEHAIELNECIIEEHLLNGTIPTLQKLLHRQGNGCDNKLSTIIEIGQSIVLESIKQQNIEKADRILRNLGLNSDKELKEIYMKNTKRNLRDFLHTILRDKGLLCEKDVDDYIFIKKLEGFYAAKNEEDTNDFEGSTISDNESIFICQFPLDQIKLWDKKTRCHEMLDAIFINDAEAAIGNDYSAELWEYLLSHNQLSILKIWIGNVTYSEHVPCKQSFPDLPEEMPIEFITDEVKETLLHLLVKHGYYPECIKTSFPDLLYYISKNKLLFCDLHPMQYYRKNIPDEERNELVNEFNNEFICFCQDNELVMVLWHYICHYGISLQSITIKDKIKSWLSMMLSFHDVAAKWKESSDDKENLLFTAISENARFLHNPSENCTEPYTLNDMLRNNQPIIALASVLVCQNKFADVFSENESLHKIDKELLKEALKLYPQLYESICSGDSTSNDNDCDITMYKLLNDNTELDVSRWFTWQPNNDVKVQGNHVLSELPHFSHPYMVKKYAHEVKLDHMFYLEQGRPMYAYLVYMRNFSRVEEQHKLGKHIVAGDVYKLGMINYDKKVVLASSLFFLDLLEVDNEKLRADAQVALNICKYWSHHPGNTEKYSSEELKDFLIDSFLEGDKSNNLFEILKSLENTTEIIIHDNKVNRLSYDAVMHWRLVISFSRMHNLPLSTRYIEICCEENDWLQLFLFIHLYQLPPEQVVNVVESHMENKILRDHILAIVNNIKPLPLTLKAEEKPKKRKPKDGKTKPPEKSHVHSRLGIVNSKEKVQKDNKSSSTSTSSLKKEERSNSANTLSPDEPSPSEMKEFEFPDRANAPDNVIDIILICDMQETPWKSLIGYGLAFLNEIFLPLAACYDDADLITCHCIWYICSISEQLLKNTKNPVFKAILGRDVCHEDIPKALFNHTWSERDLSILVKHILEQGIKYSKFVVQGFRIYQSSDIRIHILDFFQVFVFDEETDVILEKVRRFQMEYETNRKKDFTESCFKSSDDITICEKFSYLVIEVLLSLCKNNYQVHRLICILADSKYGHSFTIRVPDFACIQKTVDIICKTDVVYPIKKLCANYKGFDMKIINEIFDELLKASYYDEASELANIHCLPQSKITRQKVVHDLVEISETRSWKILSTRHAFMNKVDKIFFDNKCCCNLAASFFEEQASMEGTIYTDIERSYLLQLALQWYHSSIIGDKSKKISKLEKQVWMYQIKAEIELIKDTGLKKGASLLNSANGIHDISKAYFQRTCSNITMNQYSTLTELLQEMKEEEGNDSPLLTQEEFNAFDQFISKLLDRNCITEARRVASYFSRTTECLEIVLAGIYLAQGNQTVDGLDDNIKSILAATTSRHITISALMERSGSFSRDESPHSPVIPSAGCMTDFVFIEEIQNALEKLTLRVNHGKRCLQRVLVTFKIATMLSMSYEDAVTEDFYIILKQVFEKGIDQRFQLSKQFIKAFELPTEEVATFIAETMITWIKMSCGIDMVNTAENGNHGNSVIPTRNYGNDYDDIVSLLQLTEDPAHVGKLVLTEMIQLSKSNLTGSRSSSDLTFEVELLIYAHHCFTVSCEMEGIARILHFAGLCTKSLARLQLHSQMVRLLCGIGRFNEMAYVIETLYNQHHFELLCKPGQFKEKQLKTALLEFLKKYHPKDHENFRIVAHAFGMHREIAKHHESVGMEKIEAVKSEILNPIKDKDIMPILTDIKETFTCAADYYVKEECLQHAQSCIRHARLAELQMKFIPAGLCILALTPRSVGKFLREHKDFLESYIVADSYNLKIPSCFVEPIYHIVLLNGNLNYFQQYQNYFQLSSNMIMEIAMIYKRDKNIDNSANMKHLLNSVCDLKTKLKIARELNFSDVEARLLDGGSGAYLRDQPY